MSQKKRLSVVAPSSVRPDNTREGRELRQTIPQDKGREFHSRLSKKKKAIEKLSDAISD